MSAWYEIVIAAHTTVTTAVSHTAHMKSSRYFVWQEESENDLEADGRHAERSVIGTTDLFTKTEFDSWVEDFEAALDTSGHFSWSKISMQYEPDTGYYHHEWRWTVFGYD